MSKRAALTSSGIAAVSILVAAGGMMYLNKSAGATPPPIVLGGLPYQTMLSHSLTDRASVLMNAANGNMVFATQDLSVRSAGPGLNVTRFFNGLASGSGQTGSKSTLSIGPDVSITPSGSSAIYQGPSGFQVVFTSNGTGGYTTPAGFTGGTLAAVSGGGWTMTMHSNGEVYTFNASGKLTKDANSAGLATTYAYSTNGTLASATDDQAKTTTFTNYSGTNVGTITDPSGRTVQYRYTSGELTGVTDTTGNEWKLYDFGGLGNLDQIDDTQGHVTSFTYDSSHRVTSVKYDNYTAAVATYLYTYNDGNTVVTDPLGHATTYYYDTQGRVIDVVDAVGLHHGATWDANNNQTTIKDPSDQVRTATYDALNNQTVRQNPTTAGGAAGSKTTLEYADAAHPYLPSKGTDAAGNLVAYSYNVNGNVASATSTGAGGTGMGVTTSKFQGDPNGSGGTVACSAKAGQLCSTTDAKNNTTTYGYNAKGNLTSVTPPGPVSPTTYTYDSLSRVHTQTDGNGVTATITYDAADRPTTLTYSDGSEVWYTYNEAGAVTEKGDDNGVTSYAYDDFNRVVSMAEPNQADIYYTYDAAGNMKSEQGPAGTVNYDYDDINELTNIYQSASDSSIGFNYIKEQLTSITLPGGITETLTYDTAGRQTSIKAVRSGVTLTDYVGTYTNAAGQDTELLQSETDNLLVRSSSYTYDGTNRLTGVASTGTGANSYAYVYDKNGNRTKQTKNSGTAVNYGYNAANQLTTQNGNPSGTFDGVGNQTSTATGLAMGYNAMDQTEYFGTPSGTDIGVSYAGSGQDNRTQFGTTTEQNGLLGLYSDTTGTTTAYYTHTPNGTSQTVSQILNGAAYYYLTDLRGSIVKMTDSTGTVQNTYSYDPYGTLLASTGTIANPWRYAGGYYDTSTALYKYGARYYNTADARWTQLDPSGQDKGYLYAGDNPVNFVDPSGYFNLFKCIEDVVYGAGGGALAIGSGLFGVATAETGIAIAEVGFIGGVYAFHNAAVGVTS